MQESREVRDLIMQWFDAAARGDAAWVDRHLSSHPGTRLVGTDPGEWLQGKMVADFLKAEAQAMGGGVKVTHGDVEGFSEGSVGWGIAGPTIRLPNGNAFSPRWSAVLRQESGQWKFVQIHASVGVPNEQLMG